MEIEGKSNQLLFAQLIRIPVNVRNCVIIGVIVRTRVFRARIEIQFPVCVISIFFVAFFHLIFASIRITIFSNSPVYTMAFKSTR